MLGFQIAGYQTRTAVDRIRHNRLPVVGDSGSNWARVEAAEPTFDGFDDQALAVAWFNDQWVVAGNDGTIWIGTPEE